MIKLSKYKFLLEDEDGNQYTLDGIYFDEKFISLQKQINTLRHIIQIIISIALPKEKVVKAIENRIVEYLRRSGKAFRDYDLRREVLGDAYHYFWLSYNNAIKNLQEKGVITIKKGWIKLKEA